MWFDDTVFIAEKFLKSVILLVCFFICFGRYEKVEWFLLITYNPVQWLIFCRKEREEREIWILVHYVDASENQLAHLVFYAHFHRLYCRWVVSLYYTELVPYDLVQINIIFFKSMHQPNSLMNLMIRYQSEVNRPANLAFYLKK